MKTRVPFRKKALFLSAGFLIAVRIYEIVCFISGGKFLPEFFHALYGSFKLIGSKEFLISFSFTFLRSLLGLVLSRLLGFFLGLLAGYYSSIGTIFSPLLSILRSIPRIAIIFLLALYVPNFYYLVVFRLCFPICFQASREGSEKVRRQFGREFLLYGNKGFKNLYKVVLPLSLPYDLRALRECFGLAFKGEIRAETFGYNSRFKGLGKSLYRAYQNADFALLASESILLMLFIIRFDLLLSFLKGKREERRLH